MSPIGVQDAGEIERALTDFARSGDGGLIVTASPFLASPSSTSGRECLTQWLEELLRCAQKCKIAKEMVKPGPKAARRWRPEVPAAIVRSRTKRAVGDDILP